MEKEAFRGILVIKMDLNEVKNGFDSEFRQKQVEKVDSKDKSCRILS
jgi:hypothetical protein